MPTGYARILVPVDFSTGSRRAVREARKLLREDGELVLVHVTRHLEPTLPWSATNRRVVDKLAAYITANVTTARGRGSGGLTVRSSSPCEPATASDAAPPKLIPTSAVTVPSSDAANDIAARRSATAVVKLVREKSPLLAPNPVMS